MFFNKKKHLYRAAAITMDKGHSMNHATPAHRNSPAKDDRLSAKARARLKTLVNRAEHTGGHELRAKLLMVAASEAHRYEAMGYDLHGAGKAIAKMAITAHLEENVKHPDTNKIRDLEELFRLSRHEVHDAFNDAMNRLLRDREGPKARAVNDLRAGWKDIPLMKD